MRRRAFTPGTAPPALRHFHTSALNTPVYPLKTSMPITMGTAVARIALHSASDTGEIRHR